MGVFDKLPVLRRRRDVVAGQTTALGQYGEDLTSAAQVALRVSDGDAQAAWDFYRRILERESGKYAVRLGDPPATRVSIPDEVPPAADQQQEGFAVVLGDGSTVLVARYGDGVGTTGQPALGG